MRRLGWLIVLLMLAGLAVSVSAAELEIQVVYDNTSAKAGMEGDWGFAAVVTLRGRRVLFDSGTKPELFLANLRKLRIDPGSITHAIISHQHGDHINGIYRLFPLNPSMEVYFLDNFPDEAFEQAEAVGMKPRRVRGQVEIMPGIYSTGMVDGRVPEQALVVETSKGLVMLVGCSHPGVVKLVETAQRQRGADTVRLVLGGYHMSQQTESAIRAQVARLKELNVVSVVPAHCTGDLAQKLFREAYGEEYDTGGAGKRVVLE